MLMRYSATVSEANLRAAINGSCILKIYPCVCTHTHICHAFNWISSKSVCSIKVSGFVVGGGSDWTVHCGTGLQKFQSPHQCSYCFFHPLWSQAFWRFLPLCQSVGQFSTCFENSWRCNRLWRVSIQGQPDRAGMIEENNAEQCFIWLFVMLILPLSQTLIWDETSLR